MRKNERKLSQVRKNKQQLFMQAKRRFQYKPPVNSGPHLKNHHQIPPSPECSSVKDKNLQDSNDFSWLDKMVNGFNWCQNDNMLFEERKNTQDRLSFSNNNTTPIKSVPPLQLHRGGGGDNQGRTIEESKNSSSTFTPTSYFTKKRKSIQTQKLTTNLQQLQHVNQILLPTKLTHQSGTKNNNSTSKSSILHSSAPKVNRQTHDKITPVHSHSTSIQSCGTGQTGSQKKLSSTGQQRSSQTKTKPNISKSPSQARIAYPYSQPSLKKGRTKQKDESNKENNNTIELDISMDHVANYQKLFPSERESAKGNMKIDIQVKPAEPASEANQLEVTILEIQEPQLSAPRFPALPELSPERQEKPRPLTDKTSEIVVNLGNMQRPKEQKFTRNKREQSFSLINHIQVQIKDTEEVSNNSGKYSPQFTKIENRQLSRRALKTVVPLSRLQEGSSLTQQSVSMKILSLSREAIPSKKHDPSPEKQQSSTKVGRIRKNQSVQLETKKQSKSPLLEKSEKVEENHQHRPTKRFDYSSSQYARKQQGSSPPKTRINYNTPTKEINSNPALKTMLAAPRLSDLHSVIPQEDQRSLDTVTGRVEQKFMQIFNSLDGQRTGRVDRQNCQVDCLNDEVRYLIGPILSKVKYQQKQFLRDDFIEEGKKIISVLETHEVAKLMSCSVTNRFVQLDTKRSGDGLGSARGVLVRSLEKQEIQSSSKKDEEISSRFSANSRLRWLPESKNNTFNPQVLSMKLAEERKRQEEKELQQNTDRQDQLRAFRNSIRPASEKERQDKHLESISKEPYLRESIDKAQSRQCRASYLRQTLDAGVTNNTKALEPQQPQIGRSSSLASSSVFNNLREASLLRQQSTLINQRRSPILQSSKLRTSLDSTYANPGQDATSKNYQSWKTMRPAIRETYSQYNSRKNSQQNAAEARPAVSPIKQQQSQKYSALVKEKHLLDLEEFNKIDQLNLRLGKYISDYQLAEMPQFALDFAELNKHLKLNR